MNEYHSDQLIKKYLDRDKLKRFLDEVQTANQKFNLYSRNFSRRDLELLVAESLIPLELGWINNDSGPILDIGSGWGIPALPIFLTGAKLDISLVERSQKKADFLLLLIHRLELEVKVITGDLSMIKPDERYNLVSIRGVALDRKIQNRLRQIIKPGGCIIYFGLNFPEEWRGSSQLIEYSIDNLSVRHLIKYSIT